MNLENDTVESRRRQALAAEPMTDAQRRALFATARAKGIDRDALRDLTPEGSVKMLTRSQASELLDRLNRGRMDAGGQKYRRPPRLPHGVYRFATEAQSRKVDALRIDLGWTPEDLQAFLKERRYLDGRPMATAERCPAMDTTADGSAVIELLKSVSQKAARAARRRRSDRSGG